MLLSIIFLSPKPPDFGVFLFCQRNYKGKRKTLAPSESAALKARLRRENLKRLNPFSLQRR